MSVNKFWFEYTEHQCPDGAWYGGSWRLHSADGELPIAVFLVPAESLNFDFRVFEHRRPEPGELHHVVAYEKPFRPIGEDEVDLLRLLQWRASEFCDGLIPGARMEVSGELETLFNDLFTVTDGG